MYGCQRLHGASRGTSCGSNVIANLLLRTLAHVVVTASLSAVGRAEIRASKVSDPGDAKAKVRTEKAELELRARHTAQPY